jgi:hypothetical protein
MLDRSILLQIESSTLASRGAKLLRSGSGADDRSSTVQASHAGAPLTPDRDQIRTHLEWLAAGFAEAEYRDAGEAAS